MYTTNTVHILFIQYIHTHKTHKTHITHIQPHIPDGKPVYVEPRVDKWQVQSQQTNKLQVILTYIELQYGQSGIGNGMAYIYIYTIYTLYTI